MAGAPMERTRWPGIYRRGDRWAFEWTDAHGKRRRGTCDSCEDARALKAAREADAARGELGVVGTRSTITVAQYARDLFGADLGRPESEPPVRGRYQGRSRAVRDSTRDAYRRQLELHVLPALGGKAIGKLTTPDLTRLVAQLAARDGDAYLADGTLKRVTAPLGVMLATAVEEGYCAHNVFADVRVPSGRDALRRFDADDQGDADDPAPGKARALTRQQITAFLLAVEPDWQVLFELLAATGLRISEALALRWSDVRLDGGPLVVRVRRAYVKDVFGPPKSEHGRRDVPIDARLAAVLARHRETSEWAGEADLMFPARNGQPMKDYNLRRRVLWPARTAAGVPWAGFHTFRHTCASLAIAEGRNIVQVSRMLGHHAPSFTLDTYAHLMDEGMGGAIDLSGVVPGSDAAIRQGSAPLDREAGNAGIKPVLRSVPSAA